MAGYHQNHQGDHISTEGKSQTCSDSPVCVDSTCWSPIMGTACHKSGISCQQYSASPTLRDFQDVKRMYLLESKK